MLRLEHLDIRQEGFHLTADWQVPKGAKVAVIGPSGAGKSTLLMALAGFVAHTGRITWEGEDLAALSPGERPLSILFQDQNLFPHLSLAQNLGLGISPRLQLTAKDHARIEATLARVGLGAMGSRKPAQLSGGQLGRAALARALLRARPILLLDEPFAALGPALKVEMLDLVTETADETGATVLMVTHDPADARRFADLTVLVADGVAAAPVPTAALFANPPSALRDYLGT
ncbi:MAG: ATP-binding cassette domain-containing protein [Paracoccaceae bacterium]